MSGAMISLDYELFFGRSTGTVDRCLFEPVTALCSALEPRGVPVVLFVDASYLVRLRELGAAHPRLQQNLDSVLAHLDGLVAKGHEVQLHVHPHWIGSTFDGDGWGIDASHYRLHNFDPAAQRDIVAACVAELSAIAPAPIAFRAGGWCLQPFAEIGEALAASGVLIDSTLYRNGLSTEENRFYDFRGMPEAGSWSFTADPMVPEPGGRFREIPISSMRPGPWFYWRLAAVKKVWRDRYVAWGDGASMTANASYYLKRLMSFEHSPVSIDGLKAALLDAGLAAHREGVFNIMGHPKSLSPESVAHLASFIDRHPELQFQTFAQVPSQD